MAMTLINTDSLEDVLDSVQSITDQLEKIRKETPEDMWYELEEKYPLFGELLDLSCDLEQLRKSAQGGASPPSAIGITYPICLIYYLCSTCSLMYQHVQAKHYVHLV